MNVSNLSLINMCIRVDIPSLDQRTVLTEPRCQCSFLGEDFLSPRSLPKRTFKTFWYIRIEPPLSPTARSMDSEPWAWMSKQVTLTGRVASRQAYWTVSRFSSSALVVVPIKRCLPSLAMITRPSWVTLMLLIFWLVSRTVVPWILLSSSLLIKICLFPSLCDMTEKEVAVVLPSFPTEARLVETAVQVVSQCAMRFPELQFHLLIEPEDVKI